MNNKIRCALAFLVPAFIGAGVGSYQAAQEVDPYSYQTLATMWPHLPQDLRDTVRVAMADGQLTSWEWHPISAQIMDQVHFMVSSPDGSATLNDAKEALHQVMQSDPVTQATEGK